MDILTQLNHAMAYIEVHIANDLNLADVSTVTNYTHYHFGRLFYYISDMTLSEYIRKRKLSLAAMALKSGNEKVIDLAVKYGYDSADSFTRAFVKQHGVTPSAARQPDVNLTIFPPLTFQIKIKGVQAMNWRIEEKEAFEVFGIERVFANDETSKIPDFWTECHNNGEYERLFQAAGGAENPPGPCLVNAICGYGEPGDNVFPYMLCAFVKDGCKTDRFKVVKIPKTTWAIFRSDEADTTALQIPQLFSRAYSEWLPSSGYDKAPGADIEIYGIAENGKYYEEVWLPVIEKNL
ncbi:GyrI-like domain-containing protein [Jeotgalibaca porci]|uniref:GyrI-like domain-containing protein n=1 Tax=Jeotgalibaca porci TaxID=1868793 RepID=UPI0035A0CCF4